MRDAWATSQCHRDAEPVKQNNMNKKTVLIIDDEEGARESLANILNRYFPQIELVGKSGSALEGYE